MLRRSSGMLLHCLILGEGLMGGWSTSQIPKRKAANLMARHNQQIDASTFVYYFDKQRPSFENSHPQKGANATKPPKYEKTEVQVLFEPL